MTPRHLICSSLVLLAAGCGGDAPSAPDVRSPTIQLSASALELVGIGADSLLTATATNASGAATWRSSAPSVADVSGTGSSVRIVARGGGSATITATVTAGDRRAEATVAVTVVPAVTAIRLDSVPTRLVPGTRRQLTVQVTADPGADTTLRWESSAPAVAVVTAEGIVQAVSEGTTRIAAVSSRFPTVRGERMVEVSRPEVRGVRVGPDVDTLLVGTSRAFTPTLDADSAADRRVQWRSTSPLVASVDTMGHVSALMPGVTHIVVTSVADSSRRDSARVIVRTPAVRTITLRGPDALRENAQDTLRITIDGEPGASPLVTWRALDTMHVRVSPSGVVTAMRAGTTTIVATSVATPGVQASHTVRVDAAPPLANWRVDTVGVTGSLRWSGNVISLLSRNTQDVFATLRNFNILAGPDTSTMRRHNGAWSVTAGTRVGSAAALGLLEAGAQVTGWGAAGGVVVGLAWNGLGWTTLPALPAGVVGGATQPTAGGQVAMYGRDGEWDVVYTGGTSGWTERTRVGRPFRAEGSFAWLTSPISGIMYRNFRGGASIVRWSTGLPFASIPMPAGALRLVPVFRGASPDSLWVLPVGGARLARWNGSAWVDYATDWPAGANGVSFDLCSGVPVTLMVDGRVFRWQSDRWVRLGTDADVLPSEPFSGSRDISCAPDGTLRVSGDQGSIARWNGTDWVLEEFTPQFSAFATVSPSLALAGTSVGRLYHFDGTSWRERYRPAVGAVGMITSVVAWPDGRAVALRQGSVPGNALTGSIVLRFDGQSWREESGAELFAAAALWGPHADLVFAVRNDGRIVQSVRGGAWEIVGPAGAPLNAIGGFGDYALATGPSLRTVRWNGEEWDEVTPANADVWVASGLFVASRREAWVAAGLVGGQPIATRLMRFDGAAWREADVAAIGGTSIGSDAVRTFALFGYGASNVYAVRGTLTGPRALYRWDAASWRRVATPSAGVPSWVLFGSANDGTALLGGSGGTIHVGRP